MITSNITGKADVSKENTSSRVAEMAAQYCTSRIVKTRNRSSLWENLEKGERPPP